MNISSEPGETLGCLDTYSARYASAAAGPRKFRSSRGCWPRRRRQRYSEIPRAVVIGLRQFEW